MNIFAVNVEKPIREISSGIVGTIGCWCIGIALACAAVMFSVAGGMAVKLIGLTGLLMAAMICGFARTASAQWKLRLTAVCISFLAASLFAEVGLRCFTHFPVNMPSNMVPHPDLGYVLDPNSPDVDANGFRNPEVLTQADIVAIGDSHTQGLNAASQYAWPQLLGEQTKQTVYNMGVRGYGPLQYDRLIDAALALKPKQVVIGLYLGNDLGDVSRGIRERHCEQDIDNQFRHTLKYHTAAGSAMSHWLKQSAWCRSAGFQISHPTNPTFVAEQRIRFLTEDMDLAAPNIKRAFTDALQILKHANDRCDASGTRMLVSLIPTRESVYCHCPTVNLDSLPSELTVLLQHEERLRATLKSSLAAAEIETLDLLPSLVSEMSSGTQVYSAHDEGHPLVGGYRVYARAVESALNAQSHTTN